MMSFFDDKMKHNIKSSAKEVMSRLIFIYKKNKLRKDMKTKVKKVRNLPLLSSDEVKSLKTYWSSYGLKVDQNTYRWYKHSVGIFDPRFIPEDIYACEILARTNNTYRCSGINDKNLFDIIFSKKAMPATIIKNVDGVYVDKNQEIISLERAIEICSHYDKVVVKPAIDSCQGKNVKCILGSEFSNALVDYKKDFIVQELVKQHSLMAEFNESSVNVVRLTTVINEENIYVISPIIRVGAPGAFTDHFNIAIGINDDGTLKPFGIDTKGNKITVLPNGTDIAGKLVPNYSEMKVICCNFHKFIPQAKIIGWDVTVDQSGNVVVIEANLDFPGIVRSQDCNGPLFGEATDEILDYVFNKR